MAKWFSQPVAIYLGGSTTYQVATVEKAAELLLDHRWPKKAGRKYQDAVVALLEADANMTGAAAAKDAGVPVKR